MADDLDVDSAMPTRYGAASRAKEDALCCPVEYDPQYLKILPAEIVERDYGGGDPSRFVRGGETVLDLGSGGGNPQRKPKGELPNGSRLRGGLRGATDG